MFAPLVTLPLHESLLAARRGGCTQLRASVDLGRTMTTLAVTQACWQAGDRNFPYLDTCRDRTVYRWDGASFEPLARYSGSLVKLVPTTWGPPTFEIDGIKMLPTAQVSPWDDARAKVELVRPRGATVLDTCGGLGYYAAWCLEFGAERVLSFEKNADVLWLRELNPWSPSAAAALELVAADVTERIGTLPTAGFDVALHDPPRFGIAGELYSGRFYDELARVLRPRARLFHYTGAPNRLTTGRDVPREVQRRLEAAGFAAQLHGDGVLATRRRRAR